MNEDDNLSIRGKAECDEPVVDYLDGSEFVPEKTKSQKKRFGNKPKNRFMFFKVALVIAVVAATVSVAVFSIASLFDTANANSVASNENKAENVASTGMSLAEDDRIMLDEEGYDPDKLMKSLTDFSDAYFNWNKESVTSESWKGKVSANIDEDAVSKTPSTNELNLKLGDEYVESVSAMSNVRGELVEYVYVSWDVEASPALECDVPACDVTIDVIRPALNVYSVNSPAPEVNKCRDVYHVMFTPEGKVFSVQRVKSSTIKVDVVEGVSSDVVGSGYNTEVFAGAIVYADSDDDDKNVNEEEQPRYQYDEQYDSPWDGYQDDIWEYEPESDADDSSSDEPDSSSPSGNENGAGTNQSSSDEA